MSANTAAFDAWMRSRFVELNTQLEELYFVQDDRANVLGVGDELKHAVRDEGHEHVVALLREGNTGDGFASAFDVLGSVGMYLAALRRHELTNPAREDRSPFPEASSLAMHIGASIGMVPRFATSHLTTHNRAERGVRKSFTSLPDEFLFHDENTRAILGVQRAADALTRIAQLGVTSPVAEILFADAKAALEDVLTFVDRLFDELDPDRFFYCVRPYFKPHLVGRTVYRGANAGDFSGVNEVDLLLGVCQASDPSYAQLLVDKMLFMLPGDQQRLRECMMRRSLLDEFLGLVDESSQEPWFRENARAFLEVCDLYGQTAARHHDRLVSRFIELPSRGLAEEHLEGLTASGPPLPVLLRSLEALRDQRLARGGSSRHAEFARLRGALGVSARGTPS